MNIQQWKERYLQMKYDSFPVDPDMDTVNNCLRAVEERADMLVLVVGGFVKDFLIIFTKNLHLRAKKEPGTCFLDSQPTFLYVSNAT